MRDDGNVLNSQDMEAAHRAKLMQGTRSLQRASESVNRSRQIAAETDEVGVNIIGKRWLQRAWLH